MTADNATAAGAARVEVLVCVNHRPNPRQPCCARAGGEALAQALEAAARGAFVVTRVHCLGHCERGPNVRIAPAGAFYHRVGSEAVAAIAAVALRHR